VITLPKVRPQLKWHEQLAIRRWVEQIFRLTSRRSSYSIIVESGPFLAYVDQQHKIVSFNSTIPTSTRFVRFGPDDVHEHELLWLKAAAAHEAGHVRHSRLGPQQPTVHNLWNCIEDERMERLMVQEYPELAEGFTFIGDIISRSKMELWDGSAHEGVLFWRFEHDRAVPLWTPRPDQAQLWEDIRPLVEAGWEASNSDVVADLAWEIARRLNLKVNPPEPTPNPQPPTPPEPGGSGEDEAGEGTSAPNENNAESGEDEAGEGTSAPNENNGDSGQKSPSPTGTQAGDPQGGPENGDASTPAQPGGTPEEAEENAAAEEQPTNAEKTPPETTEDTASQPAQGQPDSGVDESPESIRGVVSASGAGSEQQDAPAAQPGGRGVSSAVLETLPQPPAPSPAQASVIAVGVEGHARRLSPLLKPLEKPHFTTPHRSRGRYSYTRDMKGCERVYRKKTRPAKPRDIFLDLLIDRSGSMNGENIVAARAAAMMVLRAAALSQARIRISIFDHLFEEVINRRMPYLEAAAKVAGIQARGNTRLAPALSALLSPNPQRGDEVHVVCIICDGQLEQDDGEACLKLVKAAQGRDVRFIPVLIGAVAQQQRGVQAWTRSFGYTHACLNVDDLAKTILSSLTAAHNRVHS